MGNTKTARTSVRSLFVLLYIRKQVIAVASNTPLHRILPIFYSTYPSIYPSLKGSRLNLDSTNVATYHSESQCDRLVTDTDTYPVGCWLISALSIFNKPQGRDQVHSHDSQPSRSQTLDSHITYITKNFNTTIKLRLLIEMLSGILFPTHFSRRAYVDFGFTQMMIFLNSLPKMAVWTSTTATVPFADKAAENWNSSHWPGLLERILLRLDQVHALYLPN